MKPTLVILFILNVILFPFGVNLPQENPEELFLTDKSYQELLWMKKEFDRHDLIFISNLHAGKSESVGTYLEERDTEFSSLSPLLPGHGVMEVPPMGDARRFQFLTDLSQKFPELTFAGDAFTNSNLAGMSLKIQKVLFPIVFALIFFGLILLTKNLKISGYLFLSSLLGTTLGLFVIRTIYGHTTILTNLTPLIAFILTLGVGLHVVYGLNFYQDKELFFKAKIKPVLIMMATTILGFAGLLTSELPSIRQLALSSSLTLTATWAILLGLLKFKLPEISLNAYLLRSNEWVPPKRNPVAGMVFLFLLTISGAIALIRMPVLVEAIEFFPADHAIKKGYRDISRGLGGTPQFDLFISRKDKAALGYSDYVTLGPFEEDLGTSFQDAKILGLISLVKFANQKYSGSSILPDNYFSFQMLAGKIPSILRHHLATDYVLRLSIVTRLLSVDERRMLEEKLTSLVTRLPPSYELRIGGLNHLILESQASLVKSLINSFFASFIMITLVFAAFSRNLKETLIFGFLNFASVMGGLGLMWLFGFSLNVSSVMTVSISMGLVVDSTIHLMHAKDMGEPHATTFRATVIPIILSHALLFAGFAALSLESFIPIRDFSLGLIILLLTGLICDLFILPMISKD